MRQIKLMRIFIMLLAFVFSTNSLLVFAQTESVAFNNPNQPFGHFEEGSIYSVPGQLFTPHDPNDATNLYSYFPNVISPSGNISLNAEDLAKYVQVHLRGLMGRNTELLRSSTIKGFIA